MYSSRTRLILATAALLIPATPILAEDKPASPDAQPVVADAQAKKPENKDHHTVGKDTFKLKIAVAGTLMPSESHPLAAEPKRFGSLRITDVRPHASKVKKGQPIVQFDLSKLDDEIDALEKSIELKKISTQRSKLDFDATTKLTPIALEETESSLKKAEADYNYLIETTVPIQKEEAERSVINNKRNLAYAQEELRQLQKMYTEDDLTEETEEIVLKRIKWSVDNGEFTLRRSEIQSKHALEVSIPRSIEDASNNLKRTNITHEKAKIDLPAALQQKSLEYAAVERGLEQAEERLQELKADREALSGIVAPIDGIVLYGDWSGDSAPARVADSVRNIQVGRSLGAHSVFATVVPAGNPGFISAKLHEGWRSQIGWRGGAGDPSTDRYAILNAANQMAFGVTVDSMSPTIGADGQFAVKLAITDPNERFGDDSLPPVNPGMAVNATLVDYTNTEAIVVPTSHIRSKFSNGRLVRYVVKIADDGSTMEVPVTYTRTADSKVEILSGVVEGDVITK